MQELVFSHAYTSITNQRQLGALRQIFEITEAQSIITRREAYALESGWIENSTLQRHDIFGRNVQHQATAIQSLCGISSHEHAFSLKSRWPVMVEDGVQATQRGIVYTVQFIGVACKKQISCRPYQGSNLGSSAPETDALSTGPQGHTGNVGKFEISVNYIHASGGSSIMYNSTAFDSETD